MIRSLNGYDIHSIIQDVCAVPEVVARDFQALTFLGAGFFVPRFISFEVQLCYVTSLQIRS